MMEKEAAKQLKKICKQIFLLKVTAWLQARSSEEEHGADALALRAEERRDKLRKAMGRSKYPVIHGYLNGETRQESFCHL